MTQTNFSKLLKKYVNLRERVISFLFTQLLTRHCCKSRMLGDVVPSIYSSYRGNALFYTKLDNPSSNIFFRNFHCYGGKTMQNAQTLAASNIQNQTSITAGFEKGFGKDAWGSASCNSIGLNSTARHTLWNRPKNKQISPAPIPQPFS